MLRILVVDDNPNNLDLTSRMLRRAGYGVETAVNGESGVKMAEEWRYDLIVMDMAMPGISGGEATKLIRDAEKASGTPRVPVIAFTANAIEEFRQRAMRSDMDDFVTKPIERRQLLAAIERSVDDRVIVLVADDNAMDRDRTLRYLRAMDGVGTIAAGSAAEAYSACTRQRVSCALLNVSLPDLSGVELVRQIRGTKYGGDTGIIAVNDSPDTEARKGFLASGCVGYLEKPYGQAELIKVIEPLLMPVS